MLNDRTFRRSRDPPLPAIFGFAIFLFVIAGIVLVVGIGARVFAAADSELRSYAGPTLIVGIVIGFFGLVFTLISSYTAIGTQDIGVVTSFGKPVDALSNGVHFIAPWQKVTTLDGAIQTDSHTNDGRDCVKVRIAHQATACVDVSIRWQIKLTAADALFRSYRQFDHIRDSLVTRDLNSAMNDQFESYDVLAINTEGAATAPPASAIAAKVLTEMQQKIGDQIDVLSVIIPVMHFDESTQSRINALQAQIAQTRIAQQAEQTAKAQAGANRALAASVSHDPNVLVSRCYDLLAEAINKGYQLPAGFSCVGSSGAVVVPSK